MVFHSISNCYMCFSYILFVAYVTFQQVDCSGGVTGIDVRDFKILFGLITIVMAPVGKGLGLGPLPSIPHAAKSVPQNLKLRKIVFFVWHPNYLLNLLIFPCMAFLVLLPRCYFIHKTFYLATK